VLVDGWVRKKPGPRYPKGYVCPPQVIGGESVEVLHQSRVFAVGQG
jgi:hypothetical protein